jgi:hypothetical protein
MVGAHARFMVNTKDPNQGEGDRISARRYDEHVEAFVAQGKPAEAAKDARAWVDAHPDDAARAERATRRGPHTLRTALSRAFARMRAMFRREHTT